MRRVVGRGLTGLAIVALLFVLVLVGFRVAYGGKVYPAISSAGVALGGMPRDEAAAALATRTDELNTTSVTFTFDGQTYRPTLAELGITFDTQRTLDEAYAYGREDSAVERLQVAGGLLQSDHTIPLYANIDNSRMDAWFASIDQQLGLVPHDAFLVVEGTQVTIEPEVAGTVIDREAARAIVTAAVAQLTPANAELPVVAWIPNVNEGDLAGLRDELSTALSEPVEVEFNDQSWTLEPETLSQFITQTNDRTKTGAEAVTVGLDQDALAAHLSTEFASQVYLAPVDAEVGWNGGPVAVAASVDGHELRPQEFASEVTAAFFGGNDSVEIPVNVLAPAVDSDNLGALGITTRLGRGDSNYSGSDYGRSTNIGVGANLINGTLVAPGSTFSFNHSVGIISAETGFVDARVIEAERIGVGVGGGICQVSTTVFRAALLAGLPISEWWPHAQRISFYERDGWGPGFDASILQPEHDPMSGGDFKFDNSTGAWLLIESYVDGSHVVVNIYGAETGWDVTVSDAEVSDPIVAESDIEVVNPGVKAGCVIHTEGPLEGLYVSFQRTVLDREGNLLYDRVFPTTFNANGNVFVVSPDMAGASVASGGYSWGNCDFSAMPS
ncbi:MAG TPA: VanW family protein [Thermomicrobiales bacterium]|nr:VanW family protein [Thermomicrobiales bacterium]